MDTEKEDGFTRIYADFGKDADERIKNRTQKKIVVSLSDATQSPGDSNPIAKKNRTQKNGKSG